MNCEELLAACGRGDGSAGVSLAELLRALEPPSSAPGTCIQSAVDMSFLVELERLSGRYELSVSVDQQLHRVRVEVLDELDRDHCLVVKRKKWNEYSITETSIPHAPYQDVAYATLEAAVDAFCAAVSGLKDYFHELQRIDALCWVIDPPKPTFKDDYRRIVLEERAWLHIEVGADGSPGRLRAVGGGEAAARWEQRLTDGLASWRPESDIVDNIMCILALDSLPQPPAPSQDGAPVQRECDICLCAELPGTRRGPPQPLCANTKCGSFYHTACLYQWLVASSGGVGPKFGVATGKCPNCLGPVCCVENDS